MTFRWGATRPIGQGVRMTSLGTGTAVDKPAFSAGINRVEVDGLAYHTQVGREPGSAREGHAILGQSGPVCTDSGNVRANVASYRNVV